MKLVKQTELKINWLTVVTTFVLGVLIVVNIFLIWNNFNLQNQIEKLKADDLALAQVINNILSQIQPTKAPANSK